MDDSDFHNKLSDRFTRSDGAELLRVLKTAGVKDIVSGVKDTAAMGAKKAVEYVSRNKATTIAGLLGAAAAGTLQYKANKPREGGKPSLQRSVAEEGLAHSERGMNETKAKGQTPGYAQEFAHSKAKAMADLSKVQEKFPGRSALQAIPIGAGIGTGLGWAIKRLVK